MRSCLPVFWLSSSSLTFSRLRVCEIHRTGKGARWGFLIGCTSGFAKVPLYFLHIEHCAFIWLTVGWSLVAAVSRHSGLWSSSTHTRDIAPFFQKPSLFFIDHQYSILPLPSYSSIAQVYKASWPWKLVHPHKRHCWVTTVTDLSNLFSPFAKQNQAEVWLRFQSLLKLLLWNKVICIPDICHEPTSEAPVNFFGPV